MGQIFAKVIPIIVLITVGYIIGRTQYLEDSVFRGIKKIVFDIALPSFLFISFINIEMKAEYIGLNLWVIFLLLFLNGIGRLINRIKPISNPVLPYVLSGACFGLLGIPLYSTAFGAENVANYAIMAIGHEIFIWLIYVSLLRVDFTGEKLTIKGLINTITSPLIMSILFGILFNLFGLSGYFSTNPILAGVYQTLNYLAQLGTPLILLIVGYDLKFDRAYTKLTLIYTLIRRVSFIGFGLLMAYLILPRFMELTIYHQYALITFFILPPPYGLSIFVEMAGGDKELGIIGNNVVVLDTTLCIISFIGMVFVTSL